MIFVRPDLIVVVVISLNNFITADRYKSSGIFANKMQTNEASVLVRHIVVIVRSCNLTTWVKNGNTSPSETQFKTV